MTTKAADIANQFRAACEKAGFTIEIKSEGVVAISKTFRPGDMNAFVFCGMDAPGLLCMLGAKGGSRWGTDGVGVGGMSAVNSGCFRMNQSGVPLRVARALAKGGV